MSYQQIDTPQLFSPANTPAPATPPPTFTTSEQEHQQPQAQPTPHSVNAKFSDRRTTAMPTISPFQDHCWKLFKGSFQDHPNLSKTINSCCSKKFPNTKHYTGPHKKIFHKDTKNG